MTCDEWGKFANFNLCRHHGDIGEWRKAENFEICNVDHVVFGPKLQILKYVDLVVSYVKLHILKYVGHAWWVACRCEL